MALCSDKRILGEEKLLAMAKAAKGKIANIFLHWTAGAYGHCYDDYHFCIDRDGTFEIPAGRDIHALELVLAHTWRRNTGGVGIAIEAARGAKAKNPDDEGIEVEWGKQAVPTPEQFDGLARSVAIICYGADIPLHPDFVMTHAEIADTDGYGIFDSDPEMKWDLFKYPGVRGDIGSALRQKAQNYLEALKKGGYPWKTA